MEEMGRDEVLGVMRAQTTKVFASPTKGVGFISPKSTDRTVGSFRGFLSVLFVLRKEESASVGEAEKKREREREREREKESQVGSSRSAQSPMRGLKPTNREIMT